MLGTSSTSLAKCQKLSSKSVITSAIRSIIDQILAYNCHERYIRSPRQGALVEWSHLRLFKAKEGRSYLQGSVRTQILEFCRATPPMLAHASACEHVTWPNTPRTVTLRGLSDSGLIGIAGKLL
jgi:hypothetical protein